MHRTSDGFLGQAYPWAWASPRRQGKRNWEHNFLSYLTGGGPLPLRAPACRSLSSTWTGAPQRLRGAQQCTEGSRAGPGISQHERPLNTSLN